MTTRRKALKLGLAGLLLPVIRIQDSLGAENGAKRLVFFYTENGTVDQTGPAVGSETNFNIQSYFKPLDRADIKQNGIFVNKTTHAFSWDQGLDVHGNNKTAALCHASGGRGPSIDQVIANGLNKDANFVFSLANLDYNGPFYQSSRSKKPRFNDPFEAHAKLFDGIVSSPQESMQMIRDRRSVLDIAYMNCKFQRDKFLGRDGKMILEQYCENIRKLEIEMGKLMSVSAPISCEKQNLITGLNNNSSDVFKADNTDAVLDAMNQLTAMAFQCESKSIVGFNLGGKDLPRSVGMDSAPQVEGDSGGYRHHGWTHNHDRGNRQKNISKIYQWYAKRFVALYDLLKETKDVTGKPLADSTIMTWVTELGGHEGAGGDFGHQGKDQFVTLLGNGNGYFKSGRCLSGENYGRAENGIYIALAHYMGVKIDTFGEGKYYDKNLNSRGPWDKLFG